ncbi:MAG: cysteine hydrolase [Deltaproteobacteria bacterium]|nr:cysteine hydrolase [Deltaproteobacteria bacterium]
MISRNAALLVIDVQRAIDHPSWGKRNNPRAEENIGRLLAAWRQAEEPVIHVRHFSKEPSSTYRPGQEGSDFKPEVQPRDGETILTKHTNNAFIGTDLEVLLKSRGIFTLVICGVITNNSVEATARMAGDLGWETYVASDATATFDKVDFSGKPHAAEEVHAMSLANLQGEYATILSTQEIIHLLEKNMINR